MCSRALFLHARLQSYVTSWRRVGYIFSFDNVSNSECIFAVLPRACRGVGYPWAYLSLVSFVCVAIMLAAKNVMLATVFYSF